MRRAKRPCALAIGVFDGVHRGHRALLETLEYEADRRDLRAGVYTFGRHPRTVLNPGDPTPMLLSNAQRLCALRRCGVPFVILRDFDIGFANISPEDFMLELMRWGDVRLLVVGFNFRFGHNGAGDGSVLKELGNAMGCETIVLPSVDYQGSPVSSTRIRAAIIHGDVSLAAQLLGRAYTLQGSVIAGKRIGGRLLGFATANLQCEGRLLPKDGVYATYAVLHGAQYPAITNVGCNPTVQKNGAKHVETHILTDSPLPDLYGAFMRIEFIQRLRDERAFESIEALRVQIGKDLVRAQSVLYY